MNARAQSPWRAFARLAEDVYADGLAQSQAYIRALDAEIAATQARLAQTRAQIMSAINRPPSRQLPPQSRPMARDPGPFAHQPPPPPRRSHLDAALSGAGDTLTMGMADPATSALRALRGGVDGWGGRYQANLQAAQAEDSYDARHFPVARAAGQVAGAGGALALMAPLGAAGAVARFAPTAGRLGQQAGHVFRLSTTAGAGSGLVGQSASDAIAGRLSPFSDYVGAVVGGALGGLAAPAVGAVQGSAIAGGAIPAAQAAFAGQMPSLDEVSKGFAGGALLGPALTRASTAPIRGMTSNQKGRLGETLSLIDTHLRGEPLTGIQKRVDFPWSTPRAGFVKIDHQTPLRNVEAKFGPFARLTDNQKRAIRAGLLELDVIHWLPRDLAAITGVSGASLFSGQMARPGGVEPPGSRRSP